MAQNVLIILSTGEKDKALTGLLYATNAVQNHWVGDIKICFFGPFEKLLVEDQEVQSWAETLVTHQPAMACKYISDNHGISEKLTELGITVEYVGRFISDALNEGYVPMVF